MENKNYAKLGIEISPNLIKKRSIITSDGQVIKQDENPEAFVAYLRGRRR